MKFHWQEAVADIRGGLQHYELWVFMAWLEVVQQYRRSVLGPFWITLTTGVYILVLSFVFGILLNRDGGDIIPWITLGVVLWGLLTGFINDCCTLLAIKKDVIRETRRPYTLFVVVKLAKNSITFLHNLLIFLVVLLVYSVPVNLNTVLVIPGIGLVMLALVPLGVIIAVLSLRFRDLAPLINSLLMVGFFATPIIWHPARLGDYQLVAELNPFTHLIALVREPLLGQAPDLVSWGAVLLIIASCWICCIVLLARVRRRIVFWL